MYLCAPRDDGSRELTLIMAKARVAPITAHTLPRLELPGNLLAVRLVVFVRQALRLPDTTPSQCWTDNSIVLSWMKADPTEWKQFVSNRVQEIHTLTSPSDWGHCRGELNPADLHTRGISAESLLALGMWFHGPEWLRSASSDDAVADPVADLDVGGYADQEVAGESLSMTMPSLCVVNDEPVFPVERWGSMKRAVRVVGWMHRFVHNARSPSEKVICRLMSWTWLGQL